MPSKKKTSTKKITINRKKKPVEEVKEVEVKEVTLEEAIEEITKEEPVVEEPVVEEETPVTTVVEEEMNNVEVVGMTKSQVRWEIVWTKWRTTVQQPRWRIKFEAQVANVPLFKLPEDIRRYLVSNWLPTSVWKWDKERLEKKKVDMNMVNKLKEFLSNMW